MMCNVHLLTKSQLGRGAYIINPDSSLWVTLSTARRWWIQEDGRSNDHDSALTLPRKAAGVTRCSFALLSALMNPL